MLRAALFPLLIFSIACWATPYARAEGEGREDLEKATQLQLKLQSLNDVKKVIELSESALAKGLDEEDTKFAKELIVSSLWQRASQLSSAIFDAPQPHPRWPAIRRMVLEDLEKLLGYDDEFADAYLLTARLQGLPRGDSEEALEAANRAIELLEEDPEERSKALVLRARVRQEPEKQLADLNEAIELDPENAEAWQIRAAYYLGRGEHEKAVEDFQKLLEQDEQNVGLHQALAETLINLEKYDLALEHIEKAIELDAESATNYLLKSQLHGAQNDLEAAIAAIDQAVALEPDDVDMLLDRARLHYLQEDFAAAREDVDKALELQPNSTRAILLRSMVAASEGRFHEAIPDLQKILKAQPDNVELKLQLATFYVADKRPRKAIETLSEVIEATKESPPDDESRQHWTEIRSSALRTRGDALLSIGKHAKAIGDYEEGLELTPEDDGILNNLAWVLATSPKEEVRNGERAIELATKACEVTDYEKPHILSTLAAAYAETGDFETAIEWSSKAVELGREEMKDQIEQLESELESYEEGKPWRELQEIKEKPDLPRRIINT